MNDQVNDKSTSDEFGNKLNRLFAEQNESLSSDEFMLQMVERLQREQRKRQYVRVGVVAIMLLLAAIAAPRVTQATIKLISLAGKVETTPVIDSFIAIAMLLTSLVLVLRVRKRI